MTACRTINSTVLSNNNNFNYLIDKFIIIPPKTANSIA